MQTRKSKVYSTNAVSATECSQISEIDNALPQNSGPEFLAFLMCGTLLY